MAPSPCARGVREGRTRSGRGASRTERRTAGALLAIGQRPHRLADADRLLAGGRFRTEARTLAHVQLARVEAFARLLVDDDGVDDAAGLAVDHLDGRSVVTHEP